MKFSEIELPSNRKFGFFFTFVFAAIALYLFDSSRVNWAYTSLAIASVFLIVTLVRSNSLSPLNKLWMRFGLLLGMVVSPIVLGIIFFGVFTTMAVTLRLIGRDELSLKLTKKTSYWVLRNELIKPESFRQQF